MFGCLQSSSSLAHCYISLRDTAGNCQAVEKKSQTCAARVLVPVHDTNKNGHPLIETSLYSPTIGQKLHKGTFKIMRRLFSCQYIK